MTRRQFRRLRLGSEPVMVDVETGEILDSESPHRSKGQTSGAEVDRSLDDVCRVIVDTAYRLHLRIGPGLLESVYLTILHRDLERRGLHVAAKRSVSFDVEGLHFHDALQIDLLVNDCVVVELKSVERLARVHMKQLLTYLRVMDLRIGVLLNFGAPTMKE